MNFVLDVLFLSMTEVITAFVSSIFLVPLTIFTDTVVQIFTGAA
jgi:hypothetical protein